MNANQKYATLALIAGIVLAAYYAPWVKSVGGGASVVSLGEMQAPLWETPRTEDAQISVRLKTDVLAMEWIGMLVVYFLILAVVKTPDKPANNVQGARK